MNADGRESEIARRHRNFVRFTCHAGSTFRRQRALDLRPFAGIRGAA
jgi:hypothetical protein